MESYLISSHYDLITPDGYITEIKNRTAASLEVIVKIKNISPAFAGYHLEKKYVFFNLKSTLAQIGINSETIDLELNQKNASAEALVRLNALSPLGQKFFPFFAEEMYIGKLFGDDQNRIVKNPEYLTRLFNRQDRYGKPLLCFGTPGKDKLILEKINEKTIAFVPLKNGTISLDPQINPFFHILSKVLKHKDMKSRELILLFHQWQENEKRTVKQKHSLLVRTPPLHVRTVFAKVSDDFLPPGVFHTSACILQPDTEASGDVFELYGSSDEEIKTIPLQFYTLEAHREHVFFEDRDQLQSSLENPQILFKAFETAPSPANHLAAVFIVKGTQLIHLSANDWISRDTYKHEFPGMDHPSRQALLIENYINQQPSYPFLKAIEDNLITSQGVLLARHFPSPLLKRLLLSDQIQRNLKAIYFQHPSRSHGDFFSNEDRSFLVDLAKFAIPVFWVDQTTKQILQYTVKPHKEAGMFVPLHLSETFRKATFFGVYGSNLIAGNFENELSSLLTGVMNLKSETDHHLLNKTTPLALVTGGGPGAMELGNRVAKKLKILSCANIVDFRSKDDSVVNEQIQNPHIEAKMTYRLDRLVERQAEFYLDFPIFLMGGIGMDFEYALEELQRKTGAAPAHPILLFGEEEYWKRKITSRYACNAETGTIKGSEWISNCFYCVTNAEEGLKVLKLFFNGNLQIGKKGPVYNEGFCTVAKYL